MKKWIKIDERSEQVSGKVAFVFLGLTQAGLLLSIFLQRYIYHKPPAYYNDAAIVFGASVAGFWIINLLFGGLIPELSARAIAASYIYFVLSIALPYLFIRGLPQGQEWLRWAAVLLGGPAVIVAGYGAAAALGRKRLERLSSK